MSLLGLGTRLARTEEGDGELAARVTPNADSLGCAGHWATGQPVALHAAGNKRRDEPLRLAHLDHGDDRAIKAEAPAPPQQTTAIEKQCRRRKALMRSIVARCFPRTLRKGRNKTLNPTHTPFSPGEKD